MASRVWFSALALFHFSDTLLDFCLDRFVSFLNSDGNLFLFI